MRLFDVAINLADPMFKGIYREKVGHANDFSAVLKRAVASKVEQLLLTGVNYSSSLEVRSIAQRISSYSTAGIHPTHSNEFEKDFERIRELLLANERDRTTTKRFIKAIGECGLDYDRLHFAGKKAQIRCFEKHFDLAEEFKLPMFLHSRAADEDFLEMIARNRSRFTQGLVHSFTGSLAHMKALTEDHCLYIGINGCSLKTSENLEVVKEIPIDKLLLETDAPWCDCRPTHSSNSLLQTNLQNLMADHEIPTFRSLKKEKFEMGQMVKSRNEPCNLYQILFIVAALKKIDPAELAEQVWKNTVNFLGLDEVTCISIPEEDEFTFKSNST